MRSRSTTAPRESCKRSCSCAHWRRSRDPEDLREAIAVCVVPNVERCTSAHSESSSSWWTVLGKMIRRMFRAAKWATFAVLVQPRLLHQYSMSTPGFFAVLDAWKFSGESEGQCALELCAISSAGGHLALPRRFIIALPLVSANRWNTMLRGKCLAELYKRGGHP